MNGHIEQRQLALHRAQHVRLRRASEKARIGRLPAEQGLGTLAALIADCPDWLAGAWVDELLLWPAKQGTARAKKLLTAIEVRGRRRLRDLSARQRERLVVMLGGQVNSSNEGGKAA